MISLNSDLGIQYATLCVDRNTSKECRINKTDFRQRLNESRKLFKLLCYQYSELVPISKWSFTHKKKTITQKITFQLKKKKL